MHEIYELKDMLMKELKEYGMKGEMTAGSLDVVDKLAHTIKNLDKIIETYEEEEYSSRGSYEGSYRGGNNRNRSYRGGSYARRREQGRDNMGRFEGYSRDGDMVERLRDLMNDAPDERTRQEFQRLVTRMEQM